MTSEWVTQIIPELRALHASTPLTELNAAMLRREATLLRIVDFLQKSLLVKSQEVESLKNGKAIGSLHHQIVTLEVKSDKQAAEINRLR